MTHPMKAPLSTRIVHLHELPQHTSTVAGWIFNEFWATKDRFSIDSLAAALSEATSKDAIPMSLLAVCSDEPVGTVNLIENDDKKRPHLRPWLAALFVVPECRGRGIGSPLVRTLQQNAARLGVRSIYLGTDNPGFYTRLGATTHEQLNADFHVMLPRAYTYYRCTYYNVAGHPRTRVTEAEIDRQVLAIFDSMRIEDEALCDWFRVVLRSQTADAQHESLAQRSELQRQETLIIAQQEAKHQRK